MEIRNVAERPTLAVRVTTPVAKLSEEMGTAYRDIAGFMAAEGLEFAGPPYALYRNMDMNALDVEIGFPLSVPAKGNGRILAGTIPGGPVAASTHTGAYEGIATTYEKLKSFVEEQNREAEDWCYEFYLNSPEDTAPELLKTEVFFPLRS